MSSKKIAVYGTGKIAKAYIQNHSLKNIVACLDRVFENGEVCGVPIRSFGWVIEAGVDTIVIAAARKHVKLIYDRIFHKCLLHHIAILNVSGYDLVAYYGVPEKNVSILETMTQADLYAMIETHDIISFDVFDTLIMRTTLEPRDIFDCVQTKLDSEGIRCPDYKYYRITAEHMSNGCNGNIYDIYRNFQEITGLSEEITSRIMQEELLCEKTHIIPRKAVVEAMKYAIACGKKVNLISDMYLSEALLRDILEVAGITGYDQIFVSCDCGCTKATGLFEEYKKKFGDRSYLHIGDVEEIDIIPAKKAGVDAFRICSARDMLCLSDASMLYDLADTLNEKLLVGQVIATIFNSPFSFSGTMTNVQISSFEQFAVLLAPLVVIYLQELQKIEESSQYEGVIFLARDGYLFKKIYEQIFMSQKLPAYYLMSSRKLSIRSGVQTLEELEISKKYVRGEFGNPVLELYGVDVERTEGQSDLDMIDANAESIITHAQKTLAGYKNWIDTAGIDTDKPYLLCELNGYGTSHYYLGKIFTKPLDAMFLVRNHGENEFKLDCHAIWEFDSEEQILSSVIVNNPLLEVIFTSMQPSSIDMTEEGTVIFAKEKRSAEELLLVQKIQDEIENFTVRYLNNDYRNQSAVKRELAEQLLRVASICKLDGECVKLTKIIFLNDVGNIKQNLFTGEII